MPLQQPTNNNILHLYGLGDYNSQQVKVFAHDFEIEGLSPKNFYDRRPDAHPDPDKYIKEMEPKLAPLIVPDAFAGDAGMIILKNMNLEQLEKIGAGQSPLLRLAIKDALSRVLPTEPSNPQIQEINQYISHSPAWQI